MKVRQRFILCTSGESFEATLNQALDNGAQVISETVSIQETGSGRQWFSCVVEYEPGMYAPELKPEIEDETTENEAGNIASIEKLMMGFAAASGSHFVHLLYNNNTSNYFTLRGDGDVMEIVPNTLSNSPYRSLAAAILEVQSNGS